jgi:AraC-like DNA-binding protein
VEKLGKLAAALRPPPDYFSGVGAEPWCWPLNLIAFTRTTRQDLQRRTFESRLHTRYVLVINLRTCGTLNLDSTPYRLEPGQAHLVFPHQLHTYHNVESDHLLWLFVTFELPDDAPLRALRQTTVLLSDTMKRLLEDFLADYRTKNADPHVLQSALSEILLRMVKDAGNGTPLPQPLRQKDSELLAVIHRHHSQTLPEALTVKQLAGLVPLSESRLRARFRETFGLSLGEYLHGLRLQEAVAMMRHSQASLTEVALSCGFSSSSSFSRAFKHWAGTTPRAFRQAVAPATPPRPHRGRGDRR